MSEHLDKAKGALAAAKEIIETAQVDGHGMIGLGDLEEFSRKLAVAHAQAAVAQAEALTRLADALEDRFG